jgi:MFS family permease
VSTIQSTRLFYGWWIVVAAFLNLFFAVGMIFYGFPVFYSSLADSLGFTRAQLTQGFLLGFLVAGLPFGLVAGTVIDRIGARWVILAGVGLIGVPLMLMGSMTKLWHYEVLCIIEVLGYVLAGPISNQVLVARWFQLRRGRAMGYAYLGLGLGGVVSPLLSNYLIRDFGWRHALELIGFLVLAVLVPVGIFVTRSAPADLGFLPDGLIEGYGSLSLTEQSNDVLGAVGAVIQHLILFLKDAGYSAGMASRFFTALLVASLGGRVLVGYVADRLRKKDVMALFYGTLSVSILLLNFVHYPSAIWAFAAVFGFSMGADYMLIPLVAAECFGTVSLGKLLAIIILGYSLGQWGAPWIAGRIFDARHGYELAWNIFAVAGLLGGAAIFAVSPKLHRSST